jgi:hypothetical protein
MTGDNLVVEDMVMIKLVDRDSLLYSTTKGLEDQFDNVYLDAENDEEHNDMKEELELYFKDSLTNNIFGEVSQYNPLACPSGKISYLVMLFVQVMNFIIYIV